MVVVPGVEESTSAAVSWVVVVIVFVVVVKVTTAPVSPGSETPVTVHLLVIVPTVPLVIRPAIGTPSSLGW